MKIGNLEVEVYQHHEIRSFSSGGASLGPADVAPWTAVAARSGNPVLPQDVYDVLVEECAKYPGPVRDESVFGKVLNATAWRTRHLGMGLSEKRGGHCVSSPTGGTIAEDIICRRDGHHWDVLGAAGMGNPLNPGRGPSIGIIDLRARPWVAPVQPAGAVDPTPKPNPQPPPPSTDLSAVKAQLATVIAQQQLILRVLTEVATRAAVEGLSSDLHRIVGDELLPHIDDVKRLIVGAERQERFR